MNALQEFAKTCHERLMHGEKVNKPRKYLLETRSLTEQTLIDHGIGYCPWGVDLDPNVRFFGEDLEDENKRDWQYSIWGRIVVPICDEFGNVISLATKKPAEGKNPWWNLPFIKSHSLFLINKAKKTTFLENRIYVVEGYIDALTLYQNGLHNVVAIMGTALTMRKIAMIARYCNNICFCFDVDENQSGQKASDTSIITVNKYAFCDEIAVIDTIPVGEDPDSFVCKNGLEAYLNHERVLSAKDINRICYRVSSKAREEHYAK
jgi:DNA primase catalytic core